MQDLSKVKEHLLPGDILLLRNTNDKITEVIDKKEHTAWRKSLMYLGENKVAEVTKQGAAIHPLEFYSTKNSDFGVFRLKLEELSNNKDSQTALVLATRRVLKINLTWYRKLYRWIINLFQKNRDLDYFMKNKLSMVSSEFVALVYEEAGYRLQHFPPHQFHLYDIDESPKTVRII